MDCSPPDALQVEQVVRLCLPPLEMSSIPSFPPGESLLMKDLLSLRRGRGVIKMRADGELGRERGEGESSVGVS